MATSPEIQCRRATHADCDATMAINRNVYDGLDYLQYKFHNFIDDPLRLPFVAVIDGMIVGYQCGHIIDDGTTLVSEANRVHSEHQGKGVMTKLDQVVMTEARKLYPTLQRTMWTATDLERSMQRIKKNNSIKLLVQRPRVAFDSSCAELDHLCASSRFQDLLEKYKVAQVRAVPQREAIDMLRFNTDFQSCVPEGALLVNFQPWRLYHKTYVDLLKTASFHISEEEEEEEEEGFSPGLTSLSKRTTTSTLLKDSVKSSALPEDNSYEKLSKGDSIVTENKARTGSTAPSVQQSISIRSRHKSPSQRVQCFSFHAVCQTGRGARCRIDFYCPQGVGATEKAVAHLLYHIREVTACNMNTAVSFGFLFGQHIDKQALQMVLTKELGLFSVITTDSNGLLLSMPIKE